MGTATAMPEAAAVGMPRDSEAVRASPVPVADERSRVERVLIVDNDVALLALLGERLESDGFGVQLASSGAQALAAIAHQWPDLVILDLIMPGMDGEELAARIKRMVDIPIVILSAIADATSKARLIERFADDYVTKPFDYPELLARIRRVRHRVGDRRPSREVRLGPDLTLVLDRRECWVGGIRAGLSPTEARLLSALVATLGEPVSTSELVARGWSDVGGVDSAHVWVTIRRLRQKLEPNPDRPRYLLTERGVGYRLVAVT
jgi:DNA-binding response OmpR family regulator